MTETALVQESRQVLAHHARSFRWAGALLPRAQLDRAAVVYAWCRLVDDLADEAPDPHTARRDLAAMRAELVGETPARPLVQAFRTVLEQGGTSIAPALHLLDGVTHDLEPVRLPDVRALHRYGYDVAGTVGLMMCAVLGVRDRRAWPFAVDLGVAMQITNICRDVREDAERGRVYLPAELLVAAGLSTERLLEAASTGPDLTASERQQLRGVVVDLLHGADAFYASGGHGMVWIPLRARFAIEVAARVYRGIGARIVRTHHDVWASRAHVGLLGKVGWTVDALLRSCVRLPSRPRPHLTELHQHLRDLPGCNA